VSRGSGCSSHSTTEKKKQPPGILHDLAPPTHDDLTSSDVVILDGCHAAMVHWGGFQSICFMQYDSIRRKVAQGVVRFNIVALIVGLALCVVKGIAAGTAFGVLFILYFFGVLFASPYLVRAIYGGKFWATQPWFFGFEGYMPVDEIETKIWGARMGRLSWNFYASSPLAHHRLEEDCEYLVPEDPCLDARTRRLVEKAKDAMPGDMRVFTLVDTYSMTVTLFQARRPPEVLLVCGSEGGMQRTIGCSFEWTSQTFFKETVLRLETRVLERMDRIRRVRLGIRRIEKPTVRVGSNAADFGTV